MIAKNNSSKRGWLKGAIIGAIIAPVIVIALCIIQRAFSHDSDAYEAIHLILYYGSWPVLKLVFATLDAFGVTGDAGLAYLFPIFALIFLYWVVIGFMSGAALGAVRLKKDRKPNHGLESTSAPPAAGTLETHP